jgi:hypothetical protein
MIQRSILAAVAIVALAAPAYAQKFEASFTGGYSTSEGVSGDAIVTPSGTFNTIDVKSGGSFGLSFGAVMQTGGEIGFMWGRQMSKLGVSGPGTSIDIGDMDIDHYHGYFGYNFIPGSHVRPYLFIGIGATHYGGVDYTRALGGSGTISGQTQFSTTWGAGVKAFTSSGKVGVRGGIRWTPTYITSEAEGWWCDPFWGCYVTGDSKYAHQFEVSGGVVLAFGGN